MTEGPRRGVSLGMPRAPIALFIGLATLVALFPLLRSTASDAKSEARPPKAVNPAPAPASPASARSTIHALGRLAPESGLISVGVRPGARIERIPVKEGDRVTAGAVLAVLEGYPQAELQVALAEAQKKDADAQRARSREKLAIERQREDRQRDHEDRIKKERLDAQEKLVDLAKRRLDTSKEIYKTLGQAAQGKVKYDLDMAYYQAEAEAIKVQQELKELKEQPVVRDLIDKRRAIEDRQTADHGPDADVLDRQIDLARAALDPLKVPAPVAGRILDLTAHVGEISSGPLLYMADLTAMTVVAEVYQSDVPEVRVGDPAEALIQGKKVAGKVTRIGRLVGKNTMAGLDPRALQDRRVVPVTIRLDDAALAADYVNMEVDVTIRPQQGGTQ
jgi:HlyD family secretion protein